MARTTATAAVLLVNMEAAFTAVLGAVLLGERLAARGGIGIALSSLGAALILNVDRADIIHCSLHLGNRALWCFWPVRDPAGRHIHRHTPDRTSRLLQVCEKVGGRVPRPRDELTSAWEQPILTVLQA